MRCKILEVMSLRGDIMKNTVITTVTPNVCDCRDNGNKRNVTT